MSGQAAHLLNVHGVAGIGKTRFLAEAAQRLREEKPGTVVLDLNLQDLPDRPEARPEALLRALLEQEPRRLKGTWRSVDQVAADLVEQLNRLASGPAPETPVYLFVDTTEQVQEDMQFWNWMEHNLVGPLVLDGKVRQIFAGRVPVPWRRFEVRRAVELLPLDPLDREKAGRELLGEVLKLRNPALSTGQVEEAVSLLADLSYGHPLLSEQLADAAAPLLPQALDDPGGLQRRLSQEVVAGFVTEYLFHDVTPPWNEILEWASVLRWFDPLLLRRYLEQVDSALVEDKPEYFFIQGVARLRKQDATVWNVGEGMALHGILRDIVRRNLEILRPDDFRQACRAAAAVFRELAGELSDEAEDARQCLREAEHYDQHCLSYAV